VLFNNGIYLQKTTKILFVLQKVVSGPPFDIRNNTKGICRFPSFFAS